ncbi:MAG: response regulator transcription factor, partial [Sinomicrobium sp.]|nr:response regulator transcription factor [Sinomicrobium sp.]
ILPTFVAMSTSTEQAYKVIKNGFFDLLLKPVKELDLRKALRKYDNKRIIERRILCLKSYTDYRFVNTDDILYLKADNNSTDIFTSDGKVVTGYQTMKYFEELLPENFIRIHHSYIINVDHVTRIHFGKLKCSIDKVNHHIPFSRTYKENVDYLKEALAKSSIRSLN